MKSELENKFVYWLLPDVPFSVPPKQPKTPKMTKMTKSTHMGRKGRRAKTKTVLKPVNQVAKLGSMQNLIF